MKKINEILEWLADHPNVAYSFIRVFLGAALFVRGIVLMSNPEALLELAGGHDLFIWFSYITIGHLLGGLLIALGIFTRVGAFFQIPILLGAVFIVSDRSLVMGGQSIELASMVLFLLLVYFVFGSGSYSLGKKVDLPNL